MATTDEINALLKEQLASSPNLLAGIVPPLITHYTSPISQVPSNAPVLQSLQEFRTMTHPQPVSNNRAMTVAEQRNHYWREQAEYDKWVWPLYLHLEDIDWQKALEIQRKRWHSDFVRSLYFLKNTKYGYKWGGMYPNPQTRGGRLIQRDRILPGTTYRLRLELPILTPAENDRRKLDQSQSRYQEFLSRKDAREQAVATDERRYLSARLKSASQALGGYDEAKNRVGQTQWQPKQLLRAFLEPSTAHILSGVGPEAVGEILAQVEHFWQCWRAFIEAEQETSTSLDRAAEPATTGGKVSPQVIATANDLSALHPIIQNAAARLFADGHYRQALLDAYIALVNAVRTKAQRPDLDGSPLMDKVFSPQNPILRVADDPNEQQGFMMLFKGAVMAIRNPKAHSLVGQADAQRAREWLAFASVLLRKLDEAELVQRLQDPGHR